jgi:hypothetical protein
LRLVIEHGVRREAKGAPLGCWRPNGVVAHVASLHAWYADVLAKLVVGADERAELSDFFGRPLPVVVGNRFHFNALVSLYEERLKARLHRGQKMRTHRLGGLPQVSQHVSKQRLGTA